MVSTMPSRSQEIRSKLRHPIIDSDGHNLELNPALLDYVQDIGGRDVRDRFEEMLKFSEKHEWVESRTSSGDTIGSPRRPGGECPPATRTTGPLRRCQKLLHRRMDELGIDYAVIYPTWRPGLMRFQDEGTMRSGGCRVGR